MARALKVATVSGPIGEEVILNLYLYFYSSLLYTPLYC